MQVSLADVFNTDSSIYTLTAVCEKQCINMCKICDYFNLRKEVFVVLEPVICFAHNNISIILKNLSGHIQFNSIPIYLYATFNSKYSYKVALNNFLCRFSSLMSQRG